MRAAVVNDVTRPPVYGEFPDPQVPDDRVEVEVLASAVHQIVRAIASGRHYSGDLTPPFVPGVDGIVRTPDGVRRYGGGVLPPYGMLAERAAIRPGGVPVPDGLDDATAAALVNPATSSWVPLSRLLPPGGTVLILGATGTSGLLAVQVAKLLGAGRVVAAGRNPDGLEQARARGADVTVQLEDDDLGASLAAAADGYDVVLDYLWGDVARRALAALVANKPDPARPVRFVNLGSLSGPEITLSAALLRGAPIQVLGHGIGSGPMDGMPQAIAAIFAAAAEGKLEVGFTAHPLADVEAVWDRPDRIVLQP